MTPKHTVYMKAELAMTLTQVFASALMMPATAARALVLAVIGEFLAQRHPTASPG